MLSFISRVLLVGFAAASFQTVAAEEPMPEFCETHPNSDCPDPSSIYRYPKFSCPGAQGYRCSVPLPQAVISCEQNNYGDTFCQAWPQGANPALHYSWRSSNPVVALDGADSPMQFLNCAVNGSTTISVVIRDNRGRSTSSSILARCKVIDPSNPNNQLPP